MRELKFRVWDPVQHKMLRPDYLLNSNDGPSINQVTQELSLVLEQYTGLDDINGRPIYEGDILKVTAEDMNFYMAPVKWCGDDGYPAFDLNGHYIPHLWSYEANALSTIFAEGEHAVVVGNVHENPKLLEVRNEKN